MKQEEIQICFNRKSNVFTLSGIVFGTETTLPKAVARYVEVRQNHFFKPHKTFFIQFSAGEIFLVQEISWEESLPETLSDFLKQIKYSRRLLHEIAIEEHAERARAWIDKSLLST